jgi:glutamyl-tRNA reductase
VDVRESVFISERRLKKELASLQRCDGVQEAAILSTCNRTEVYCAYDLEFSSELMCSQIEDYFAALAGSLRENLIPHLYVFHDRTTVEHLMCVASGLDSLVIGENQILAQVKSALGESQDSGAAGPMLNALFQQSLAVGKRVRTQTLIGEGAFSIGSAAVDLALQVFGESLSGRKALVLGAGTMSELTARHLQAHGVSSVIVANRTLDRAALLAEQLGGGAEARSFYELPELLETADIAICSTAAPHTVIDCELMETVLQKRRPSPLFLIDIAAPRDVDPNVGRLPNVVLYNIDDLKRVMKADAAQRSSEAEKARRIVEEAADDFLEWWRTLEASPLVVAVRQKIESLMLDEIARLRSHLPGASPRELKAVEQAMRSLSGKIAHSATIAIKRSVSAPPDAARQRLEGIRSAFGLDEPTGDKNDPD